MELVVEKEKNTYWLFFPIFVRYLTTLSESGGVMNIKGSGRNMLWPTACTIQTKAWNDGGNHVTPQSG
jgi:hypothetical protein